MSKEQSTLPSNNQEIVPETSLQGETTESQLMMMMQRVEGNNVDLTTEQIDKILEERTRTNGYIYKERMQAHERFKIVSNNNKFYFKGLVFILFFIFSIVAWQFPDRIDQVLSMVLGLLGGFGIGSAYTKKNKHEIEE